MKHVGNTYGNPYETFSAHFCILHEKGVVWKGEATFLKFHM